MEKTIKVGLSLWYSITQDIRWGAPAGALLVKVFEVTKQLPAQNEFIKAALLSLVSGMFLILGKWLMTEIFKGTKKLWQKLRGR